MLTLADGKKDGKEFTSMAPGYWPEVAPELWNDWKWQLKNRVTTLTQLEQHLVVRPELEVGTRPAEQPAGGVLVPRPAGTRRTRRPSWRTCSAAGPTRSRN